ncbi:hypothetical protein [Absidia glauca]|uniref:Protein kinase domain-containing protein n=1 Tax=Absidia glauca TaxID=4829 RepID=A0A163JG26_ABSGL|nr:hypothetical protein [Absidia glauca]
MSLAQGVCTMPPDALNHHETPFTHHQQPLKHVNDYIIHHKSLGEGSMGCVKLAERFTDSQKIIARNDLSTPWSPGDPKDTPSEREQRTRREMTIMHLLQHPNICRLEDWACENNEYYLFLEYVDGGQLLDYIIRHGKLKEKQARKFARQIVSALDYCHRNAIVHRDLKIENILITRDENIKIIDFGLSNFYSSKSLLNTFCGSLYFAAPELLRARDYTGPEVDVWSFGVVLFVLVSGRVPFDDTSLPVLHQKIKAGVVEYPDHLTKECVDLLSNILQVDPKKRKTLAFIQDHPWMNRGYQSAISSHLLHRPPLTTLDKDIIQRMHEYGFGTTDDIHDRLHTTLSSHEYQCRRDTALTTTPSPPTTPTTPTAPTKHGRSSSLRWRRTKDDGPLPLHTVDDPLVSVYFLVKERKALGTARQDELYNDLSVASPVARSSSTFSNRSRWHTTLARSKTDRILHQKTATPALPPSPLIYTAATDDRTSLLQRSKSAAKRLGTLFQQNDQAAPLSRSQSMREHIRRIPSFRLRKEAPLEQSPMEQHLGNFGGHCTFERTLFLSSLPWTLPLALLGNSP